MDLKIAMESKESSCARRNHDRFTWLSQAGRQEKPGPSEARSSETDTDESHEPILRKNDAASSFSHTESSAAPAGLLIMSDLISRCGSWNLREPSSGVLEPGSWEVSRCLHLLTICLSKIPKKQARYATKSSSALGAVTSGSPSLSWSWSTPPPFART